MPGLEISRVVFSHFSAVSSALKHFLALATRIRRRNHPHLHLLVRTGHDVWLDWPELILNPLGDVVADRRVHWTLKCRDSKSPLTVYAAELRHNINAELPGPVDDV